MSETKSPLWTKNFISVSLSNFFLFLTFYFLLVTMPIYVVSHLGGEKAQAGLMTTVFLISAIVIRPFAGRWIEKFGSHRIFLVSLTIFLGATALYFVAYTVGILTAVRFLHGIGFGMATTATGSIAASIIPNARRGEGMGYFISSSTFAMVLGPFLGLTMMETGGVTVMLQIASASALAGLAAGLFLQLEQAKKQAERPFRIKELFEMKAIPIALVGAFFAIAYSSIISFVSVYASELGIGHTASYFFVVYAVVLLLSRPYTGKWYDRYGPSVIVYPAVGLFALGMLLLGTAHSSVVFLLAAACAGLGWGTLFPTYQTIAIQSAPPKRSAMATATFLSIFDTGIGIGSFLFGLAAASISFHHLYAYSSIYVLAGAVLYYVLYGRNARERSHETKSAS